MDLNVIVLAGRLAAPPEIRRVDSGERFIRYLITVTSHPPLTRVDVVPVIDRRPAPDHLADPSPPGRHVWVVGSVQRRFWDEVGGRRSRLEVVARHVQFADDTTVERGP